MKGKTRDQLASQLRLKYGDYRRAKREQSERCFGLTTRSRKLRDIRIPEELRRNLVAIGVAEKRVHGRHCGCAAITFYVRQKLPSARLPKRLLLPKTLHGLTCDVVQCGINRAAQNGPHPGSFMNPLRPGAQIGVVGGQPGTLGGFVTDSSGAVSLITNCHVVSPDGGDATGTLVYQPAPGTPGSRAIARVSEIIPILAYGVNQADVALARLIDQQIAFDPVIPHIGSVLGSSIGDPLEDVEKFGQRTLHTDGFIDSIDTDFIVEYDGFYALFASGLAIAPGSFLDRGDSGSLVVDVRDNTVVGLVISSAYTRNFAIPIQKVEQELSTFTWL